MTNVSLAPSAQALGMATSESPSASRHPRAGSLAASGPTKVVGLVSQTRWLPHWPTDLWGACGSGAKRPTRW